MVSLNTPYVENEKFFMWISGVAESKQLQFINIPKARCSGKLSETKASYKYVMLVLLHN